MAIETSTGFTRGLSGRSSSPADRFAIANAILKEMYAGAVVDLLNNSTVLGKYMNRSTKMRTEGQYYVVPIRIGRNEGHGHIAENGRLPDPGRQAYDRAAYLTKYYYGRIKLTGPSMSATRSSRGSFLDAADAEISGLVQDMNRTMNRVYYGDGTGRLCRIAPATTGSLSTVTVDYPGGFANAGPGTQYLRSGMRVVIGGATFTAGSGNALAIRYIKVLSTSANTIQLFSNPELTTTSAFDFTATAGTDRYLFTAASTDSGLGETGDFGYMNEPEGLASIIDDENPFGVETFGGSSSAHWLGRIDRSNVPAWRATVLDNGGTPMIFQPSMFSRLRDELETNGSNAPGVYITSHGVRQAYFDSLSSGRTYPNTMKFDGGYETLEHNSVPVVPDRDCTKGRIYAIDFEALQMLYEEDYHWLDFDGSMFARMSDRDAYQATLARYHAIGTDAPNKLGVIKDILEA